MTLAPWISSGALCITHNTHPCMFEGMPFDFAGACACQAFSTLQKNTSAAHSAAQMACQLAFCSRCMHLKKSCLCVLECITAFLKAVIHACSCCFWTPEGGPRVQAAWGGPVGPPASSFVDPTQDLWVGCEFACAFQEQARDPRKKGIKKNVFFRLCTHFSSFS